MARRVCSARAHVLLARPPARPRQPTCLANPFAPYRPLSLPFAPSRHLPTLAHWPLQRDLVRSLARPDTVGRRLSAIGLARCPCPRSDNKSELRRQNEKRIPTTGTRSSSLLLFNTQPASIAGRLALDLGRGARFGLMEREHAARLRPKGPSSLPISKHSPCRAPPPIGLRPPSMTKIARSVMQRSYPNRHEPRGRVAKVLDAMPSRT